MTAVHLSMRRLAAALASGAVAVSALLPGTAHAAGDPVAELDGRIAAAGAEVAAGDRRLAVLTEDFDAARERARAAVDRATAAAADAAAARTALAVGRGELGLIASTAYRTGPGLGIAEAFRATGEDGALLDRAVLVRKLGADQDLRVRRLHDLAGRAADLEAAARDEADAAAEAERTVEQARLTAARAHAAAQQEAARLEAERDELIARLAALQGTTVADERARQDGLARTREAAAPGPGPAGPATGRPTGSPAPPTEDPATRQPVTAAPTQDGGAGTASTTAGPPPAPTQPPVVSNPTGTVASTTPSTSPSTTPSTTPSTSSEVPPPTTTAGPPPATGTPGGSSSGTTSGGAAAVEWARTQLGKAYLWGGDGPDSYDCSGLVMRAWQQGGVALPHSSRMQYQRVAKVSRAQLRPGDLIFWASDTGRAESIYHVALYSGGGMMIEAPNSRSTVREVPVRWSGTMPSVGRP